MKRVANYRLGYNAIALFMNMITGECEVMIENKEDIFIKSCDVTTAFKIYRRFICDIYADIANEQ